MTTTGHNSVNSQHLKAFIERVEKLEDEKSLIATDIKEVYAEAKGNGYDTKVIKKLINLRKQDRDKRIEEQAILDLYMSALGEDLFA